MYWLYDGGDGVRLLSLARGWLVGGVSLAVMLQGAGAQHAEIELPRQGRDDLLEVVAVYGANEQGLRVRRNVRSDEDLLEWEDLEVTREAMVKAGAAAQLLYEVYKEVRDGGEMVVPMGLAVDERLQRGEWAPQGQAGELADGGDVPEPEARRGWAAQVVGEEEFEIWEGCQWVEHGSNDGDSFHFRGPDRQEYILRLYFVDCPETSRDFRDRVDEQGDDLGLTLYETEAVGLYAKEVTRVLLEGEPFTVVTAGEDAGGNSELPRRFGFVVLAGREDTANCEPMLAAELVARGLARRHGVAADPPGEYDPLSIDRMLWQLELQARAARLGAWALSRDLN